MFCRQFNCATMATISTHVCFATKNSNTSQYVNSYVAIVLPDANSGHCTAYTASAACVANDFKVWNLAPKTLNAPMVNKCNWGPVGLLKQKSLLKA